MTAFRGQETKQEVYPDRHCMHPGCDVRGDRVSVVWDVQLCLQHQAEWCEAYPELARKVLHDWLEQKARSAA